MASWLGMMCMPGSRYLGGGEGRGGEGRGGEGRGGDGGREGGREGGRTMIIQTMEG